MRLIFSELFLTLSLFQAFYLVFRKVHRDEGSDQTWKYIIRGMVFESVLEKVGLRKPLCAQETAGEQWVRTLIPAQQEEGRALLTREGAFGEITDNALEFAKQNKRGLNVKVTLQLVQTFFENPEVV